MICIARTFGAPETVPAGKVARTTSNGVTPSRSSPATSETRCVTCEKRSGSRKRSTLTVPGSQTRERSLRPRSTSITCSARSFSEPSSRSASPSPRSVVPGDRVQARAAALDLDVRLGRRADERELAELEQEEVRRRVDAAQRAVDRERAGRRLALGPLREHAWKTSPRADVLLHPRDPAQVLVAVGEALRLAVLPPGAVGTGSGSRASAAATRAGIAAQHVGRAGDVVEAQEHVGDDEAALGDVGPGSRQRHRRLELRDVVVTEVADDRLAQRSASSNETRRSPQPTNECRPSRPWSTDSSRNDARAEPAQPEIGARAG